MKENVKIIIHNNEIKFINLLLGGSLIANYKFENSNDVGECSFNSENNLILFDNVNIVTDTFNDSPLSSNNGVNFSNNTNGKGLITNNINLGNSTYTVSFWANQPSRDQAVFFSQGHHNSQSILYGSTNSGKLYLRVNNSMFYPGGGSDDAINLDGSWNMHTIVIRDDGLHKIYINGEFYNSIQTAIFTNDLNGYFVIGGELNTSSSLYNPTEADLSPNTNNDFQGYMQDFRIYSSELAESNIANLYNGNFFTILSDPFQFNVVVNEDEVIEPLSLQNYFDTNLSSFTASSNLNDLVKEYGPTGR